MLRNTMFPFCFVLAFFFRGFFLNEEQIISHLNVSKVDEVLGAGVQHVPGLLYNCTLRRGVGKEQEEPRWIAISWGDSSGVKYSLNPAKLRSDAVVVDIGSWEGKDLILFMQKQNSPLVQIHTYEPVERQRGMLLENIKKFPQISSYPYGLGSGNRTTCFVKAGGTNDEGTFESMAGAGCAGAQSKIVDALSELSHFSRIDLLHINCEGCEKEVLMRVLESADTVAKIHVLEVQFHSPQVSEDEYCHIEEKLFLAGFKLEYRYQFVWEAWVRE